ncbi:Gfo/Idh/MocA family protein [Rubneribacter sp.]|nr:Gfo/Idh/MocA family oxidoreductase [Candidatus Rubneribacter avistercoris]
MNYALIGCGRIAVNHVKAATSNNFNIVAFCDIDSSKFDIMLNKADCGNFPQTARYTDYRRMLADHPEIELVSIATESGSHAAIALDCIEAGKHVIIEKPIALSMADADGIVRRAAEADVRVAACHQNRFNPAVVQTRKALESGRFGRMSHGSICVRWNRNKGYYDQAPWRGTWAEDGGCLMNQCIHGIDLLRWMMGGKISSVYAQTRQCFHNYLEAEDVGVAVLSFEDGSVGLIEGTVNVYPKNLEETLCLFGERGTVKVGGTSTNEIAVWDFADTREEDTQIRTLREVTSNVYGNGHTALFADMAEAIRESRAPAVDARAGRDALEVVLAIYKSQKTGMPVELPLQKFASTDMEGEF